LRIKIWLLLVLAFSAWLGATDTEPASSASKRPNILVIVTDDQPVGTLRVMRATRRFFVRGGRRYPNAYVTTPLCCPSRTSILTGRYAHNHRVLTLEPQALDVRTTIPRYLQRSGYLTGIVGKYLNRWGAVPDYKPASPPYFDLWSTTHPDPNGYYRTTFNVNGRFRVVRGYSTRYIGNQTVDFLEAFEKRDRRPWFMYTAVFAPHGPRIAEPRYRDAALPPWPGDPSVFEGDRTDKPAYVRTRNVSHEHGSATRAGQLRTLMSVDDMVRQIFRYLRRNGEDRNTLALFVSDNGYLWGQHGLSGKSVPYLPSVKIPLLLRWPTRPGIAGSVDDRIVANIDIAPAIAHAARLDVTGPPMDGRSLLDRSWSRDHLLNEYFASRIGLAPTWAALTTLDSQYVEYYDEDGNRTFREYYDLLQDPWQLTNTLGDFDPTNDPSPILLHQLAERLAADRSCVGSSCP
jgi:arylsulfatase A-like enzyme